ncbi:S9 family peptidase [Glaciihabitans arcticus]|uniref:S9 family peptidase n=1 Tax=Glaciihabitans arcticus TaxID=2668039 RepID=A0A4Q9GRB3_9MICO|nr:S9 family peptidase [Glaciihabitans arcticus]TBN56594.1 S9 family peptidase [Glaciihabitans arcticus]
MKAIELPLLVSVSAPSLDPTGTTVVFSTTRPDLGADATVGQLWVASTDGSALPRRLTRGFRDTAPAFSPDGALIAFLRASSGGAAQLHLVAATGGEPLRLTDRALGVSAFRWSRDGTALAFTSRDPQHGRYGTVDGLDAGAESPRRITTLRYKSNGTGYTRDRRVQLFVLDVPPIDGEPDYPAAPSVLGAAAPSVTSAVQLTSADADVGSFDWRGNDLIYVSALHDERDVDLRSQLWQVPRSGGAARQLSDPGSPLSFGAVAVTADDTIFVTAQNMGASGRDFVGRSAGVYSLDGSRAALLSPVDEDFGEAGTTLTPHGEASVIAARRTRGRAQLHEISATGSRALTTGDVLVSGEDSSGGTIAVSFATPQSSGEIAVLAGDDLRMLTDFGAAAREAGILPSRELEIEAADGSLVHGWVTAPAGEGPHPVLLMIHGGPFSSYGVGLFDETQVYADAGYAVVYCNPRGAAGYGEAHGRATLKRMGTLDYTDVIDFLDGAIAAEPSLDGKRVGILGGSYGGYLTAWTIAHDDRFAAAIVERGFLDPEVFPGTSDIGDFFGQEYLGTDPEAIRAQSPQAVAHLVTTPTFVIHSSDDLRCPLGQAERYYATLKGRGVESELLIFPGENHELTRSGRPRHRVERFDAILEWWSRYLPVERG